MHPRTRMLAVTAALFAAPWTNAASMTAERAPLSEARPQSTKPQPPKAAHIWAAWGGEVSFRFNQELLRAIRLEVGIVRGPLPRASTWPSPPKRPRVSSSMPPWQSPPVDMVTASASTSP
jgi:hypothetical protein